jgi:serine/threonine-protein kinase
MLAVPASSGEVTFGGVADRGLTLAAFYESGVLERLRLEVRVRLIMDLTLSLAWLHENPRLMAAYSHLRITPSTVVIGLDGVARVDVRAAKKRSSELAEVELEYLAPELSVAEATADHRADIFSLGVLAWEALAGRRLFETAYAPIRALGSGSEDEGDVPAALAGIARADRERRKTLPRGAKASHSRLRLAPPPLSLPAGAEWALPLFEIAMQAMNLDVTLRPQDCRSVLERLASLEGEQLATHQEIAEVVQGISGVNTLCTPEPRLPTIDASCQEEAPASRPRPTLNAACSEAGHVCANPPPPAPRVQPTFEVPPELPPSPAPQVLKEERESTSASPAARNAWFWVGLLWLATAGLLAGYVTSVMAHR